MGYRFDEKIKEDLPWTGDAEVNRQRSGRGALPISVLGTKERRPGPEPPKDVKGSVKAALAQNPSEGLPLHSEPKWTLKRL
jgi:hypothetical protein